MSGKFEAIKYALRQNKDGTVISFVIHPNDCSSELNNLPIGARVEIEWTECTDEEPGAEVARKSTGNCGVENVAGARPAGHDLPHKERRPFAELPLSQQCAIRCADKGFWKWLGLDNEDEVARHIRAILRIKSRSELDHDAEAADKWRNVDRRYNSWLTTQHHGALAR